MWQSFYWTQNDTYLSVQQVKKIESTLFISLQFIVQKWNGTNHHGFLCSSIWCFKFFLGVRLHGGSHPNFNFFNVNPQIFQRNLKVHLKNCLETNFHISNISLTVIRRRDYSECEFLIKIFLFNISGVDEINNFFNVNPPIFERNRKVHLTNCLKTNFHDISIISLRVIRRRNYS